MCIVCRKREEESDPEIDEKTESPAKKKFHAPKFDKDYTVRVYGM